MEKEKVIFDFLGDEFIPLEKKREKPRKIKYGVIGTGDCGKGHIEGVNQAADDIEIAAIFDTDDQRIKETLQILPNSQEVKVCKSSTELLAIKELDAVLVATPNHLHKQYVLDAFEAGKHVFCEKPLEASIAAIDEINRAWKQSGKILQVGLTYRYAKIYRKIREILDSGAIGFPQMLWCKEHRPPFPISRNRDWRYDNEKSGGVLVEKVCHHFDLFNWFVGDDVKLRKVSAFGGRNVLDQPDDILDNAFINIEYENGVRASLSLCFFSNLTFSDTPVAHAGDVEIGILGSEGRLCSWVNTNLIEIYINRTEENDKIIINPDPGPGLKDIFHKGFLHQHLDFIKCIREGKQAFADGIIAKRSTYACFAGQKSIREGRVVQCNEIISDDEY